LEDIAQLGLLATCMIAIYVGVRTLLISRRTHKAPELIIGLNVISIAIGGALLTALAGAAIDGKTFPIYVIALGCLVVHIGAIYIATWVIFRREETWAKVLSFTAVAIGIA
jgi:hypothetical protein